MATYKVEIQVTEARYATIEVEADTEEQAYEETHKLQPYEDYEPEDCGDFDYMILSLELSE